MAAPTKKQVEELLGDFGKDFGPEGYDADWDEPAEFSSGRFMFHNPWGEPISRRAWIRLVEGAHRVPGAMELYMIVGRTTVNGYEVRTDWMPAAVNLGLPGEHSTPLIYETQLFGMKPDLPLDLNITGRYATWEGAEAGHAAAIELCSMEVALSNEELSRWLLVDCTCQHPRGAHDDMGKGECVGMTVSACECKEFIES